VGTLSRWQAFAARTSVFKRASSAPPVEPFEVGVPGACPIQLPSLPRLPFPKWRR
jgi:hypothetical protein